MSDVIRTLDDLEQEGLVRRDTLTEPDYLFKHVLIQETTYGALLRHERRELHQAIALAYETLYADDLGPLLLPLAHHHTQCGNKERAAEYLVRYGKRAAQISAYPEAIHAFEQALELSAESASSARAELHIELGDIYRHRTDYGLAAENYRKALDCALETGDAVTAATALSGLSRVATQQGNHAEARELAVQALERARESHDQAATGRALRQLGIVRNQEGNNAEAESLLNESLLLARELGDAEAISASLNSLAIIERDRGQLDQAEAHLLEALDLSLALGDRYSVGVRFNNLGDIAEQRGKLDAAEQYQRQALMISEDIGDRVGVALTEMNLGTLECSRHNLDAALVYYRMALQESLEIGAKGLALYVIAAAAQVQLERGNRETSAALLGLALRHPATTADIALDFDRVYRALKAHYGDEKLEQLLAQGSQQSLAAVAASI